MGLTFFIVFIIAEIALVVLTFTKFKEKASYRKNKALLRLCEALLLIIIAAVPTVYMKWRFAAAIAVLVIRLIVTGLFFLAKRKKSDGIKSKAGAVVSCVLSVVVVGSSLVPAFLFTNYNGLENSGSHNVATVAAILVDDSFKDPFESDGSGREVPVYLFYPEDKNGEFPLVVFSHGAFGYYQSNFSTYTELASNGYVVAALDHPHHSFFTTDTQGNTITVDLQFINDVMYVSEGDASRQEVYDYSQKWLELRVHDMNLALDSIKQAKEDGKLSSVWHTDEQDEINSVLAVTDTDKIGVLGHSLGGATSVEMGRERDDIDAVVVLDGTMLGEVTGIENDKELYNNEPYPVPILDFTKESDYNEVRNNPDDTRFAYVNDNTVNNAKDGKLVIFKNTGHMDFTDLPLISPTLGNMLGSGDVDNAEFMKLINGIVLNWFDYYLKGEGKLDIQAMY